jgi:hypothetical protein
VYLQWSNAVAPEFGRKQLADKSQMFESYYQQAEKVKQEKIAKKTALVTKTEPQKSLTAESAVKNSAAPPVVVKDTRCYLEISVSPSTATVKLDDREVDPGLIEVEPDTNHMVEISCPGYKAVKQFYKVTPGSTRKVDILLQKGKSRSIFGF